MEKYSTLSNFAEALGISKTIMTRKMRGKTRFNQDDIVKWSELLEIDLKDIGIYFFT